MAAGHQFARSHEPLRVAHVIGSLAGGGAEHSLCALVAGTDPAQVTHQVITLMPGGMLAERVHQQRVPLYSFTMRPDRIQPSAIMRLSRHLRRDRPDVVVTWMYHANLIGGLAAKLTGGIPVVWNIRHSDWEAGRSKPLTRLVARVGGLLSGQIADRVVFVAHASRECHLPRGYGRADSLVIPNGFDTQRFCPRPAAATTLRCELGLPPETELVGCVSRFHPDKDPATFLRAAAMLRRQRPGARFVACGLGMNPDNAALMRQLREFQLTDVTHLLGYRDDISPVLAALDVAICSSLTEAFPRAVGEAMACGVPCVVTDVGDSAWIVGPTGRVVPPNDAQALASGCSELLAIGPPARRQLGAAARRRIVQHFQLHAIVPRHVELWRELAGRSTDALPRQWCQAA